MSGRIRVSAAELKEAWFSEDASVLIHDHEAGEKVVQMRNGTEYATPFSELKSEPSA